MANNYMGSNNPFIDYLELEPRAAYYSSPSGMSFSGGSTGRRRHYQNQFQDVYNQFLGALGSQIRQGGEPTMRWTDYLESYPFTERYAALPPQQAGRSRRQFNPSTRHIYF